jgi:hypothetical protein
MKSWKNVVAAIALATAALLAFSAQAQTMSFEEAATILLKSCGKDIEKLCPGVNLGSGRLRNCLDQKQASVSGQCKGDMARAFDGMQRRAQARVAVLKICERDGLRLCGSVQKGDGQILECMILAQRSVSAKCNQAITDAGYR